MTISLSIIFSIYLFQTFLTFKYGGITGVRLIEKKIKFYKDQKNKKFDYRSKFKVYNDLKKKKYKNLKVTVSPSSNLFKDIDLIPLSGVSNSMTLNCNENGYYSLFESDRYGFNNIDSEWDQVNLEYLIIGDSFALGNCVNRPNDIASVLRKLSKKSVLNLGYANNGPLIEYTSLREYSFHKTKNIVWLYYEGSDLNNLKKELKSKILKNYIDDQNFSQNLLQKQNLIDKIVNDSINYQYKKSLGQKEFFEDSITFKIKKFITLWNVREALLYKSYKKEKFNPPNEFKEIMKLAKDYAKKNNSNFFFVFLPSYKKYIGKISNEEFLYVKNIVNELDIPFIDIDKEVFQNKRNPLELFPFKLPGHYNIEGYREVAKTIYNFSN